MLPGPALGPQPLRAARGPSRASARSPSHLLSEDRDQVLRVAHVLAHCPMLPPCVILLFRAEDIEGKRGRNLERCLETAPGLPAPAVGAFPSGVHGRGR